MDRKSFAWASSALLLPATSVLPFVRLSPPLAASPTVVGDDFDEVGDESRTKDDAVVLSCCETVFFYREQRRKELPVSSIKFIIYQNLISFLRRNTAFKEGKSTARVSSDELSVKVL